MDNLRLELDILRKEHKKSLDEVENLTMQVCTSCILPLGQIKMGEGRLKFF